jgi:hypothetical protein
MSASLIRAALRGVLKEPAYLLVRVFGLAVGVATACLALAFVRWAQLARLSVYGTAHRQCCQAHCQLQQQENLAHLHRDAIHAG